VHAASLGAGKRIRSVLAIGAHSDDIEIGCGGTLLHLAEAYPDAELVWVVLSGDGARAEEARLSATEFAGGFGSSRIVVRGFRDGFFPYVGGEVKDYFEQLKGEVSPDLIFTHQRADLHQDHRLVSELTWNTFRDHLVLEYEVPKYDGDLGTPNVFVHLTDAVAKRKVKAIAAHFGTQRDRHWFGEDTFEALMRLRGMESNSPSRQAEAFHCRKLVISLEGDGD
jgi:LmbE family N-acetylglucosaminyl deacetylase